MTTIIEAIDAVRRARAWANAAPRFAGEFAFGDGRGSPVVFSVYGDSLGCGVGATGLDQSFAAVVAKRLSERAPVLCRVHAVSGAQAPALIAQPIAGDERLAAVSIGTNDLLHGAPLRRLELALSAFLGRLSHAQRVVVLGPGNVASLEIFPEALRPFLRRRMLQWEAAMARVAAGFPNAAHVGPSLPGLELSREDFAGDGFHPGDRGQARIAEAVLKLIP